MRTQEGLSSRLNTVTINGFRSIREAKLSFRDVNVLVGANGTGKSNFLNFFEMLEWMLYSNNLQEYVALKGGGDDLLFHGSRQTPIIRGEIEFRSPGGGASEYSFTLRHTNDDGLEFSSEECRFTPSVKNQDKHAYHIEHMKGETEKSEYPELRYGASIQGHGPLGFGHRESSRREWKSPGAGHRETRITDDKNDIAAQAVYAILKKCVIYQFHDTSSTGPLKTSVDMTDHVFLRSNGCNLAAVLFDLRENSRSVYDEIRSHVRFVFPVFGDFNLEPSHGKVELKWSSSKQRDKVFGAHLTSDGTLRLMALVTLLCMPPEKLPDIVLLDEPELGLHPYAINLVAELIQRLGREKQVIIATQSPLLVDAFDIADIIVVEMEDGATSFKRFKDDDFAEWQKEFSSGDIWRRNIIGGNP